MRRWQHLVVLGALALGASPLFPCSCLTVPTPCQAYEEADLVAVAEVKTGEQSIVEGEAGKRYRQVELEILEGFKGIADGARLVLHQELDNCAPRYEAGDVQVFYVHRDGELWSAPRCNRNGVKWILGDDVAFLQGLPGSAGRTRVGGLVMLIEEFARGQYRIAGPLPGITVTMEGDAQAWEARTDDQGAYEVYDLPPGSYSASVNIPREFRLHDSASFAPLIEKSHSGDLSPVNLEQGDCVTFNFLLEEY